MSLTKPDPSRRRFLRKNLIPELEKLISVDATELKVVSSLILQIRPEKLDSVTQTLSVFPNAEIHGNDGKSKVVLVLESKTDGELADFMSMAAEIPGVINVCMVFHHTDSSPNFATNTLTKG